MNLPAGEASNFDEPSEVHEHVEEAVEQRAEPHVPESSQIESLLGQVLAKGVASGARHSLTEFQESDSVVPAIEIWLGRKIDPERDNKDELASQLNRDVAQLDYWLNLQVNEVIHHSKFQKLESAWRSV